MSAKACLLKLHAHAVVQGVVGRIAQQVADLQSICIRAGVAQHHVSIFTTHIYMLTSLRCISSASAAAFCMLLLLACSQLQYSQAYRLVHPFEHGIEQKL